MKAMISVTFYATGRNMLDICEIGEQGVLIDGFVPLVAVAMLCLSEQTDSSYLVDPASSHMLVSKIKPCMSKYKQVCTVKLRMAH